MKSDEFLQYLWGIETPTCYIRNTFNNRFLQYLWGIETQYRINTAGMGEQVFTVPMRNWNSL